MDQSKIQAALDKLFALCGPPALQQLTRNPIQQQKTLPKIYNINRPKIVAAATSIYAEVSKDNSVAPLDRKAKVIEILIEGIPQTLSQYYKTGFERIITNEVNRVSF